jgi:palmitoyl transferase
MGVATCNRRIAAYALIALASGKPMAAMAQEPVQWWEKAQKHAATIANQGKFDLYVSGYSYHGRGTYTAERLKELNEKAWGAGFGKSLRNAKGDVETLYFLASSDSHAQPQLMGGYAYRWMWPAGGTGLEVGAGFTAFLVSRRDYFSGFPFPGILPVASIGTRRTQLMLSYVPRISRNKGNGDVLFVFARFEFR